MHEPYPGDLLDHLRSFDVLVTAAAVGSKGTYERAARSLGVDPSVLRRRIATLEAWIGAPLLAGRGAALAPSAHGELLRAAATTLLEHAAELGPRVRGARVRVTIGCTETITSALMPRVLSDLDDERAPLVTIRRVGSAACCRMVAARELDLGVVRGDVEPGDVDIVAERLCEDRLWVAMPRGHALATRRRPSLADLAEHPLVLYGERSQTQARVMSALGPLGARVRVEVEGRATALDYVQRGLGLSFLSLLANDAITTRGVVARDVTALFPRSAFWVVWKRDVSRTPALDQLVRALRGAVVRLARPRSG